MNQQTKIYSYIMRFLQAKKETPIIFELGMHWAEDTKRLFSWCNGTPNYHGFEPDSRNFNKVLAAFAKHNMNGTLILGAISDRVGNTTLYLSDGIHKPSGNQMTGANSIRKPKEVKKIHDWIKFKDTQTVKTFTIDKYCKDSKIKKIDFIWSDVQGCEFDMLIGAKDMLPNIELMLLEYSNIELYKGQKNLKAILGLLGENWTVIARTDTDILVRQKIKK